VTLATGTTKGERTQARIIEAAIDRFGANGFRATSVAAIARDAGVSAAAPFAYWQSKEALFEAAVDTDARAVITELLGHATIDDDLANWIALVNDLLAVLGRHPLARRVLAGQEPESIDRLLRISAFDDLRSLLAAVIARGQEQGDVRADLDPHRAAIGIESITLSLDAPAARGARSRARGRRRRAPAGRVPPARMIDLRRVSVSH
jgi:AcrR family transcriptional regulator